MSRRSQRSSSGLIAAALALILFGSLFPPGYMPVRAAGKLTVSLCSASGPRSITINVGGSGGKPRQHSGSSNCNGVMNASGVLPFAAGFSSPSEVWTEVPVRLPQRTAIQARFHFDPNAPPQAPPASFV